jgi:3-methylcrotonyl-CoA carboxylase alpha subunit
MAQHIKKILIANRGEIAVRVARTCKAMGIPTVAVFSDVDADTPHVRACDQAVRIGPAESAKSYLDMDKIIDACRKTGANAIHPGFGFLSENAEFADRCDEEDIIFIGPSGDSIRSMGSKQKAKEIADRADVPVVPGYNGEDQDDEKLKEEARKIGLPALVKASAGGGGKGMRIVRDADKLQDAIDSARREASNSFGDDTLLIEKYVEQPRHIEIQVLADSHGNFVHLFERECSIQRRHQKVIEEAPSPALDDELREKMGAAAIRLIKEMEYENAGTVEFILDDEGNYYFLEVNTRLQVEHPVTEEVTGVDLVREQIRVANGQQISFKQDELTITGASIECRLYAEDPANDFLPASGPVIRWDAPDIEGLRIESGIETGSTIAIHYDPMLAKLITYGETREVARQRMVAALNQLVAHGLTTNQRFLRDMLEREEFVEGALHTHLIDDIYPDGWKASADEDLVERAALAITLFQQQHRAKGREVLPTMRSGFRNNRYMPEYAEFEASNGDVRIDYVDAGGGQFDIYGEDDETRRVRIASVNETSVTIEDERLLQQTYEVSRDANKWWVQSPEGTYRFTEKDRYPLPGTEVPAGGSTAPMTGTVIEIRVEEGDEVNEGDVLMIVEAMKMEHNITAELDGPVTAIHVEEGDIVNEGDVLVVVGDEDDGEDE